MIGQRSPCSFSISNSVSYPLFTIGMAVLLSICARRAPATVQLGPAITSPTVDPTVEIGGELAGTAINVNGPAFVETAYEINATDERSSPSDAIRLRISWGGGDSRQWQGSISVTSGRMFDNATLGLTSDAPGSVVMSGGNLVINHWTPANYGGSDVTVEVVPKSDLKIVLFAAEQPHEKFERTIAISDLLSDGFNEELDASGNLFSVARVPGDQIAVRLKRDHLVFSPNEEFEIGIAANRTPLVSRTSNCRLVLTSRTSDIAVDSWNESLSFQTDRDGSAPVQWVRVPVPAGEGVYDLKIDLEPNWYQATIRGKLRVQRTVQIVVIADQTPFQPEPQNWNLKFTFDPTENALNNLLSFAQISKMPGGPSAKTIGNDRRRTVTIENQNLLELLPGGWQAIPINVDQLDKPHLVEIEFLADEPTAIGFSLLQPDASGQIPTYGFDSGAVIPDSIVNPESPGIQRLQHEIVFWPQHRRPYLLIANRDPNRSARIGKIKVFSGPDRLPPSKGVVAGGYIPQRGSVVNKNSNRKLLAFYESPLFAESFGASEHFDSEVSQPLDDWVTFYEGADRLVQYLKSNGYGGTFLTVVSDGSAIYPSSILNPSPKYDSGTFHSSGQDPIRKDVLEMLFRMFEREGLVLVPAIAMSSPLSEVEEMRLDTDTADRFELVDFNLSAASMQMKTSLPAYNPLNRKVQKSVVDIVAELADRYRAFGSFTGLAVVCRPDTYTLLPGRKWCYDSATARQFLQTQTDVAGQPMSDADVQRTLLTTHQDRWIQWRTRQMSLWYTSMLDSLRSSVPDARLYIAPVDLYRNEETVAELSPALHSAVDFQRQMLNIGLDGEHFSGTEGLELLQPHRHSPNESLAANRVDSSLADSRQVDQFYATAKSPGELFTHRVQWAHFSQLEQQNLFGKQRVPIMRLQQLAPAGIWNRQRFLESLRSNDSRMLIDGGWMLTTGQEAHLQELLAVFSHLPDEPFQDVELVEDLQKFTSSTMPVVVRQLQLEGRAYFYAVNASPWPVKVNLFLSANSVISQDEIKSLSGATFLVSQQNQGTKIQIEMSPLSIVGGYSDSLIAISAYDFKLPEGAADALRKQVYSLQTKLVKSTSAVPLSVLQNSSFELHDQPSLSSWDFGQQPTALIRLNNQQAHAGRVSLMMDGGNQEPVWIRSNSFEPPQTGRLSLTVWLRTDDPDHQPPLRLAVEGQVSESSYYRFGSVGSLSPDENANQIGSQWQRFAVHFDDLPVERLTNLRIGFDLMGPGQVYVDDVQVLDRWFDENDAKAITQRIASCGPLLANPATFESCRLLLEGYWMTFLDNHFGPPSSAEAKTNSTSKSPQREGGNPPKSMFRRFRKFGSNRKTPIR